MGYEKEILRELMQIRYMLEDIWKSCELNKKEKISLEALEMRLEDEFPES